MEGRGGRVDYGEGSGVRGRGVNFILFFYNIYLKLEKYKFLIFFLNL